MCESSCGEGCNHTAHSRTETFDASIVADGELTVVVDNSEGVHTRCSKNLVRVTVEYPTNDPPVADAAEVRTDEDTPTDIQLTASDPDGDPLTWEYAELPSHGQLSGEPPTVTYTPDPDYNGDELFRRIQKKRDIPTIFLSRKSEDIDRILGLELGADGYMTKPFNPRELVDPVERRVFWNGDEVELTKKQFDLLAAMMRYPKKVYSRSELIRKAYDDAYVSERTIDSHVRRIRDQFEEVGGNPVETVHGVGFKLRKA